MENLIFSLNATIPIFLLMVFGYILQQIHFLDASFVKTLNSFNFKVTLPFLLFRDIASSDFSEVWDTRYVLFCFFATLFCIAFTWIITACLSHRKDLVGEFVQASYRSSAAVLGIAFIQNIYGDAKMAPLMIIGTVPLYNVAAVIILSLTAEGNGGLSPAALKKSLKGILTNPIILGIAAGILFVVVVQRHPALLLYTRIVIITNTNTSTKNAGERNTVFSVPALRGGSSLSGGFALRFQKILSARDSISITDSRKATVSTKNTKNTPHF